MIYIDTTNEEFNYELENLVETLRNNHEDIPFNENEFALVRSCNHLLDNGICHPLCNIPFLVKTNTPSRSAVYQYLRKRDNINVYKEDENYDKFINTVKKYSPYSTQYRSTVHFCLNGLVSNHSKGEWTGQNFTFIEPLKNHLNENMESLRFEDTFIKGDVKLNDNAFVLIETSKYEQLKDKYPELDRYNIIAYTGDRQKAVEYILAKSGIIPVKIKEHNMDTEDPLFSLFSSSLSDIRNKYIIGCDSHAYSVSYKEDDEKNIKLWHMFYEDFYNDLFEYFNINNDELYDYLLNSSDIFGKGDKLEEIISQVGFDNYCIFIEQYNNKLLTAKENGLLKSNNEILENGKLSLNNNVRN